MDFSTFDQVVAHLKAAFPQQAFLGEIPNGQQPYLSVSPAFLLDVCQFLHTNNACYFDFLQSITLVDNGTEKGTIEAFYHLASLPYEKNFTLHCEIPREIGRAQLPSVSSIWRTADWHEREAYDFYGVHFDKHPDLRRILLPADWEGFPMRKDYIEQENYHAIQIKWQKES